MKKRIFCLFLFAVISAFAVFSLSACEGNIDKLQMEKKYFSENHTSVEEGQIYYIFHSDGTGEYNCTYRGSVSSEYDAEYIIKFKYTYVDKDKSAVACFYDSVTIVKLGALSSDNYKDWSRLLTVSKNVLCSAGSGGYLFYINEDYLKTIPNFGK